MRWGDFNETIKPKNEQLGLMLKEAGIDTVQTHANPEWMKLARRIVRDLAFRGTPFTTDFVHDRLTGHHTHDNRAMGAIMRQAVRDGLVAPTGAYVKSKRPEAHGRPIPVWIGQ